MKRLLSAALSALLFATPLYAQAPPTATLNAFAIGKGAKVAGFTSLLCTSGQLALGSAGAPTCRTMSGDGTLSATGVLTLASVNGNVGTFGDSTHSAQITVNAKGLITAASQTTFSVAIAAVTGLGTGVAGALANNIGSAGAPVVFNGAGGTPSAINVSNGTNYPLANIAGAGAGVLTAAANAVNGTGGLLTYNPAGANKLQIFTTAAATGTITTPTGAAWAKFTMIGGGGPGQGSGTAGGGAGSNGDNTCIALSGAACTSPVYQAGGGTTGSWATSSGGTGGGCTGSGSFALPQAGGDGGASIGNFTSALAVSGSKGGESGFGYGTGGNSAKGGVAGATGSGYGGGGQGGSTAGNANSFTGPGGGGGAGCVAFIQSPAASYTYKVAATSTGGTAGTNGFAGGNGAGGLVMVEFGFN